MKKTIGLLLAMAFIPFIMTACSSPANNTQAPPSTNTNPTETVSEGKSKDNEPDDSKNGDQTTSSENRKQYFYETLDISKFDPSLFDGVIKVNAEKGYTLQAPITLESIIASGYQLGMQDCKSVIDDERYDYAPDTLFPDKMSISSLAIYKSNYNEERGYGIALKFSNRQDTIKQLLEQNLFYLSLVLDPKATDPIGSVINRSDHNENSKPEEVMLNTLGHPSAILCYYINEVKAVSSEACYVYEDYTLVFSFSDNIGLYTANLDYCFFTHFDYYTKEAWEIYLKEYKEKNGHNKNYTIIE